MYLVSWVFSVAIIVLITWNCGLDIPSLTNLKQGLLGEMNDSQSGAGHRMSMVFLVILESKRNIKDLQGHVRRPQDPT